MSRLSMGLGVLGIVLVAGACSDDAPAGDGPDGGFVDPTAAVFDPERVLDVRIELDADDWTALRNQTRGWLEILGGDCLADPFVSPFTYFPGSITVDGVRVDDVGVRKKGFLGSLDPVKPSLKVKLDEFMPGQQLSGVDDLTFNNARQDPSALRQCIGYDVFTAAGAPAARCNFAHVWVNGEDLGLYVHVEAIDRDLLRRHFDDDDGQLWEGTLSDFRDGWTGTFEPKSIVPDAVPDPSRIHALTDALDLPDDQVIAAVEQIIDLDSFIRFWAGESLLTHWDGYSGNTNNFYVYEDPADGRLQFLPWGIDGILVFVDPLGPPPGSPTSVQAVGRLTWRLYQIPEIRDRYVAELERLLAEAWDEEHLAAEIDRMEALVEPHVRSNINDWRAAVEELRDVVASRRGDIEAEIASGPAAWNSGLRAPLCLGIIGTVSGTFSTTYGTLGAPDPFATGSGTLAGNFAAQSLDNTAVGGTAGLDTSGQDGPRVNINVIAQLTDGTVGVVVYSFFPDAYEPGTHTVTGGALTAFGFRFDGVSGEVLGLVMGTLTLDQAGDTPGAAISGSFTGDAIDWPF